MPAKACVTSVFSTLRRTAAGVAADWPAEENQSGSGLGGGEEVIHALRRAEQMASSARVDKQVLIGGRVHHAAHGSQAGDKLRDGKLELADQDAACSGDGKPGAVRTGRQRKGEVG